MKKTPALLSILAVLGLASTAQAQVRIGVKAGVSLSNYSGLSKDDLGGTENKGLVNGNGGIMLNAPLSSDGFFSIQPELLYSGRGVKLEATGVESTSRLHYLDLPVLAKINADGFVFEAGPQLGYLLSQKSELKVGNASTSNTSLDDFNRVDFGYVAGVGYELESGLGFGIRYNGGITKLAKEKNGQTVTDARNSVFQFQVGYLFGGK